MKYTLSNHAFQRFCERIQKGATIKQAEDWVANAIKNGTNCGTTNGRHNYRYESYKLIVEPNSNIIVTIYHVNVLSNKELGDEIHQSIVTKVNRELRKAFKDKRKYMIEYHEANMKLWKANNPMTKKIICNEVNELKILLIKIDDDIEALKRTAKRYYIDQEKLYLIEH